MRKADLSLEFLSGYEKDFIIAPAMPTSLEPMTIADIGERWNLTPHLLRTWRRKKLDGKTLHSTAGGAPTVLDDQAIADLRTWVDTGGDSGKVSCRPNPAEVAKKIRKLADVVAERRGNVAKTIWLSTVQAADEAANTRKRKGKTQTSARLKATEDFRNAYSMAVCNKSMLTGLESHCVFNADATQYAVVDTAEGEELVYLDGQDFDNWQLQQESAGLTCCFIKYYFLFNAAGTVATAVYIIAVSGMPEGKYEWVEVPGIGRNFESAYLVFCHTRAGNDKFYEWWFTDVCIPFMLRVRTIQQLRVSKKMGCMTCFAPVYTTLLI